MNACVVRCRFTGVTELKRLYSVAVLIFLFSVFCSSLFADSGQEEFNAGNYEKALELWQSELKKNKNSAEINYNLAMLFDRGLGIQADESKAQKLYLKAAEQNYAPAMFKLGAIMARQEDFPAAAKWWLKASNAEIPEAQYNLAKLYRDGVGVEKDVYKAKYWFKKAAESAMKKYQTLKLSLNNTD